MTPATNIPYLIRDTRDTKNVHVNELEFIQDFTDFYQVGKITPTRNIPKVIIRTREKTEKDTHDTRGNMSKYWCHG